MYFCWSLPKIITKFILQTLDSTFFRLGKANQTNMSLQLAHYSNKFQSEKEEKETQPNCLKRRGDKIRDHSPQAAFSKSSQGGRAITVQPQNKPNVFEQILTAKFTNSKNDLPTVIWHQVFLSNTNNSKTGLLNWDPNKYYLFGSGWTWEYWQWKSTPHNSDLQKWNFTIKLNFVSYSGHSLGRGLASLLRI